MVSKIALKKGAFMNSSRAVYLIDSKGVLIYYNEKAAEIWAKKPPLHKPAGAQKNLLKWYKSDGTALSQNEYPEVVALHSHKSFHNEEFFVERGDGSRSAIIVNIDPVFKFP